MGKVMSLVSRKMNRFNVESRARRVLDRDKPKAAPKFKSNILDMKRALELDPNVVETLNKRDVTLNDRLKNVYVTSESHMIYREESSNEKDRPLPLNRKPVEEFEYGHKEPEHVPLGRCTIRQVIQLISNHAEDPQLWTSQKLADEYKLKRETIEQILKYYRPFQLHVPDATQKPDLLTENKNKFIDP